MYVGVNQPFLKFVDIRPGRMSANKATAESAEPVNVHGFLTSAHFVKSGFFINSKELRDEKITIYVIIGE